MIPGQKGQFVKGQIEGDPNKLEFLLFKTSMNLSNQESVVTVHSNGMVLIPLQNFQGMPVRLEKGVELGVVRECDLPDQGTIVTPQTVDSSSGQ